MNDIIWCTKCPLHWEVSEVDSDATMDEAIAHIGRTHSVSPDMAFTALRVTSDRTYGRTDADE